MDFTVFSGIGHYFANHNQGPELSILEVKDLMLFLESHTQVNGDGRASRLERRRRLNHVDRQTSQESDIFTKDEEEGEKEDDDEDDESITRRPKTRKTARAAASRFKMLDASEEEDEEQEESRRSNRNKRSRSSKRKAVLHSSSESESQTPSQSM